MTAPWFDLYGSPMWTWTWWSHILETAFILATAYNIFTWLISRVRAGLRRRFDAAVKEALARVTGDAKAVEGNE